MCLLTNVTSPIRFQSGFVLFVLLGSFLGSNVVISVGLETLESIAFKFKISIGYNDAIDT